MQDLRVLLLEDDPAVRLFLQMALEPLSLNLVPCATLAQARQALADPGVRLVLTDLALPDGSGLELLQGSMPFRVECANLNGPPPG